MLFAGKAKPVVVKPSAEGAAEAAVASVKAKAKKVPRYVKEALKEVEQEKATKFAGSNSATTGSNSSQAQQGHEAEWSSKEG